MVPASAMLVLTGVRNIRPTSCAADSAMPSANSKRSMLPLRPSATKVNSPPISIMKSRRLFCPSFETAVTETSARPMPAPKRTVSIPPSSSSNIASAASPVGPSPRATRYMSSPLPPSMRSMPPSPDRVSLPSPPSSSSTPSPPDSKSLPSPPLSQSASAPPMSVSLPPSPNNLSSPDPPSSRSAPCHCRARPA